KQGAHAVQVGAGAGLGAARDELGGGVEGVADRRVGGQRQRQQVAQVRYPRPAVFGHHDELGANPFQHRAAVVEGVERLGDLSEQAEALFRRGFRVVPGVPKRPTLRGFQDQVLEAAVAEVVEHARQRRVLDDFEEVLLPADTRPGRFGGKHVGVRAGDGGGDRKDFVKAGQDLVAGRLRVGGRLDDLDGLHGFDDLGGRVFLTDEDHRRRRTGAVIQAAEPGDALPFAQQRPQLVALLNSGAMWRGGGGGGLSRRGVVRGGGRGGGPRRGGSGGRRAARRGAGGRG